MCCIFTYMMWCMDAVQRIWTFLMACCIAAALACLIMCGAMAGVTLGYNYSLSEYMDLRESNLSVFMLRGLFEDNKLWRRPEYEPASGERRGDNAKYVNVITTPRTEEYLTIQIKRPNPTSLSVDPTRTDPIQTIQRGPTRLSVDPTLTDPIQTIQTYPTRSSVDPTRTDPIQTIQIDPTRSSVEPMWTDNTIMPSNEMRTFGTLTQFGTSPLYVTRTPPYKVEKWKKQTWTKARKEIQGSINQLQKLNSAINVKVMNKKNLFPERRMLPSFYAKKLEYDNVSPPERRPEIIDELERQLLSGVQASLFPAEISGSQIMPEDVLRTYPPRTLSRAPTKTPLQAPTPTTARDQSDMSTKEPENITHCEAYVKDLNNTEDQDEKGEDFVNEDQIYDPDRDNYKLKGLAENITENEITIEIRDSPLEMSFPLG